MKRKNRNKNGHHWNQFGYLRKQWWLGDWKNGKWHQNPRSWHRNQEGCCRQNIRQWQHSVAGRRLHASYTVEAAGVMAVVLFTMMVLFHQAFYIQGWTVGTFQAHQQVERERHEIVHIDEKEITQMARGQGWSAQITAGVFRPEESLRMWSVLEEKGED